MANGEYEKTVNLSELAFIIGVTSSAVRGMRENHIVTPYTVAGGGVEALVPASQIAGAFLAAVEMEGLTRWEAARDSVPDDPAIVLSHIMELAGYDAFQERAASRGIIFPVRNE